MSPNSRKIASGLAASDHLDSLTNKDNVTCRTDYLRGLPMNPRQKF